MFCPIHILTTNHQYGEGKTFMVSPVHPEKRLKTGKNYWIQKKYFQKGAQLFLMPLTKCPLKKSVEFLRSSQGHSSWSQGLPIHGSSVIKPIGFFCTCHSLCETILSSIIFRIQLSLSDQFVPTATLLKSSKARPNYFCFS